MLIVVVVPVISISILCNLFYILLFIIEIIIIVLIIFFIFCNYDYRCYLCKCSSLRIMVTAMEMVVVMQNNIFHIKQYDDERHYIFLCVCYCVCALILSCFH